MTKKLRILRVIDEGGTSIDTIRLAPKDGAAHLGISEGSLDKLVKAGKIRPPIAVPGLNVRLYDRERLHQDWQAIMEEAENGSANPWDES